MFVIPLFLPHLFETRNVALFFIDKCVCDGYRVIQMRSISCRTSIARVKSYSVWDPSVYVSVSKKCVTVFFFTGFELFNSFECPAAENQPAP